MITGRKKETKFRFPNRHNYFFHLQVLSAGQLSELRITDGKRVINRNHREACSIARPVNAVV